MCILFVQKTDFQLLSFVYSVAMDRNGMANNRSYKNWNDFEVLKVSRIVYFRLLYLTESYNSTEVSCCCGNCFLNTSHHQVLYVGNLSYILLNTI